MKNKKLVVFLIITNIILIGIIFSLINENKNIITEKQVIKEMSESTQVSDLQNQINELNSSHEGYAKNIQSYKTKIATAITSQKVTTSENATIDEMVTNIGNILQARTKDATATADNITKGKTAYVNGKLITGNGADNNSYYALGKNDAKCNIVSLGYITASLDVKKYIEEHGLSVDYKTLSNSNFLPVINSFSARGGVDWVSGGGSFSYSPNINYNSSTGILTANANTSFSYYSNDLILTASIACMVYLVY